MFGFVIKALLVVVAAVLAEIVWRAGELQFHAPHHSEECYLVGQRSGMMGAEDIEADYSQGIAFLSAENRTAMARRLLMEPDESDAGGAIYVFEQKDKGYRRVKGPRVRNEEPVRPIPITGLGKTKLHPHGIGLERGGEHIAIVDHQPGGVERVVIARIMYEDGRYVNQLKVDATVENAALFTGLNDVAVRSFKPATSFVFYVTNWFHYPQGTFLNTIERFWAMPWCDVVRCEAPNSKGPFECRQVATGLASANGILLSEDDSTLWVVETGGKKLDKFKVQPNGDLVLERKFDTLGYYGDNLSFVPEPLGGGPGGLLLLTAHTRALTFLSYMRNPRHRGGYYSPWAVLSLKPDTQDVMTEDMYSLGEGISAASVAVKIDNELLVGSVIDRGVLTCPIGVIPEPRGVPHRGGASGAGRGD